MPSLLVTWIDPLLPQFPEAADLEVALNRNAFKVLETAHPPSFYLPWTDVNAKLLRPASGSSYCEWKGPARYWSLFDGNRTLPQIALMYSVASKSLPANDHDPRPCGCRRFNGELMDEPPCSWKTEPQATARTPTVCHGERQVGNAGTAVEEIELDSHVVRVANYLPLELATTTMDHRVARDLARRSDQEGPAGR